MEFDPEYVYLKGAATNHSPSSRAAVKNNSRVEGSKNVGLPVKDREQTRNVCHSLWLEIDV
jgi:hypothetical protein